MAQIQLTGAQLDNLNTEDDYRREADRLLPDAAKQLGAGVAEEMWDAVQESFRKIRGFKPSGTTEKNKFIREKQAEFVRTQKPAEKEALRKVIIAKLKEMKAGDQPPL